MAASGGQSSDPPDLCMGTLPKGSDQPTVKSEETLWNALSQGWYLAMASCIVGDTQQEVNVPRSPNPDHLVP